MVSPPPPRAAGAEGDGAPDDEGEGSTAAAPTVKVGAADAEAAPEALRCKDAAGAGVVELPAVSEALAVTEGEVDATRVARGDAVGCELRAQRIERDRAATLDEQRSLAATDKKGGRRARDVEIPGVERVHGEPRRCGRVRFTLV